MGEGGWDSSASGKGLAPVANTNVFLLLPSPPPSVFGQMELKSGQNENPRQPALGRGGEVG